MYARIRNVVLVLITLLVPSLGSAQQANAPAAQAAGPTIDAVVTGFRMPTQSADSTLALQPTRRERQSVALMIVGGAAIVLGAVIEGDAGTLFMIGGAVALLIGLYKYLQ